ncbi:MAG: dynamin family protein, partial [Cellulosilyticaceae bacterium]
MRRKKKQKNKRRARDLINGNKQIEIAIIATMSSGKSTLINAMIGKEILPSKNEACTATIMRIKHNPKEEEFKITQENEERVSKKVTEIELTQLNENPELIEIALEGKIHGLQAAHQITLIDTPGPNNSLNQTHKKITYEFLYKNPEIIILFVLDGTKILTDDEDYLLDSMIELTKKGNSFRESHFIFVINKSDVFREKDNMNSIKTNVHKKLQEKGFNKPQIIFAAAEAALLERKKSLTLDEEDILELIKLRIAKKRFHINSYSTFSKEVVQKIETM